MDNDINATTISGGFKSLKGTPYWMAPEVIKQTGHGRPADIWSVACVVIEMATGKPPWQELDKDPIAAMYQIAKSNSAPALPQNLSPEAQDFLMQCLKINPKERPTAEQLLEHPFLNTQTPVQLNNIPPVSTGSISAPLPSYLSKSPISPINTVGTSGPQNINYQIYNRSKSAGSFESYYNGETDRYYHKRPAPHIYTHTGRNQFVSNTEDEHNKFIEEIYLPQTTKTTRTRTTSPPYFNNDQRNYDVYPPIQSPITKLEEVPPPLYPEKQQANSNSGVSVIRRKSQEQMQNINFYLSHMAEKNQQSINSDITNHF